MKSDRKEYARKWREANKEKRAKYAKEYHKKWYKKNRVAVLKKNKEWDAANKEKRRRISLKHYHENGGREKSAMRRNKNPEISRKAALKYRQLHLDEVNTKLRAYRKTQDGIYARYRQSAKRRGVCFCLTKKYFFQLLEKDCYYCGVEKANGIDRFNNKYGYSKKNSVACCTPCNMMKKTLTADNFIIHAKRIADHNK